ncbi:ABC transporter ATP-binding protein [Kitasatospora aureofaciens]|uniref:ABC transporter ATP-binding protein n=1 Tax=Kitasatospora aureofaciens TaxID=1894 RepID=UPI0037C7D1A5
MTELTYPPVPLVELTELRLHAGSVPVLDGVDLTVAEGETVGIVGPSGSGKTTLGLAVLGHLREGIRHTGGQALVNGMPVLPVQPKGLRGMMVGYVGQDPGLALNPYARVSSILLTAARARRLPRTERTALVTTLLDRVGLPGELAGRYPHQLSGGQQQRVVLAAALSREPRLLVLDEPTTALDLLARAEVLTELRRLKERGVALLWISHDLDAVAALADRTVAVEAGRIAAPRAPRRTPAALPTVRTPTEPAFSATGLVAGYGTTQVLHGLDVSVGAGECLAVLGVSGVGKSTLARCLAGLHRPSSGTMALRGAELPVDVRRRSTPQRAAVQLVAQNPAEALHPRHDVRTALARPLLRLRGLRDRSERNAEIDRLLDAVALPTDVADRLPGELSGGQRQRVALARALAARPAVLICDEVTASLDSDTAAGIVELLGSLRDGFGLAVVLITHDADIAAAASDRLVVLSGGRIARMGPTRDLLPSGEAPDRLATALLGFASEPA